MGIFSSWSSSPATSGTSTPLPQPEAGPSIERPIEFPPDGSTLPPSKNKITAEQQQKVQDIIDTLSSEDYALPQTLKDLKGLWKLRTKNAGTGSAQSTPASSPIVTRREGTEYSVSTLNDTSVLEPLSEQERFWSTTEQIQRCLRAVKWDARKGLDRMEEILVWRREYGTNELTAQDVWKENETGKQYIFGYDKESRPIHYMHPDRQNTKVSPEQIKHVVYQLERTVDLMPPGVENLCLCIDFGASHGGGQPTSVGQARTVLHILQTYYCERLGRAVCANVPTVFTAFYSIIKPFIDPVTKDKIRFVRDLEEVRTLINDEFLTTTDFGAKHNIYYNRHELYFPALDQLCKDRREANFQRWKELCDSKIGSSEWIIKGGDSAKPPLTPLTPAKPASTSAAQSPVVFTFPADASPHVNTFRVTEPLSPDVFADAPTASHADVEKARPDEQVLSTATEGLKISS